jgi:hypothetical protein
MMPASNGGASNGGGVGNAVVRIFVPAATPGAFNRNPVPMQPVGGGPPAPGTGPGGAQIFGGNPPPAIPTPSGPTAPPPPGAQVLAININGPSPIAQTVTVGPNASGCAPASGGTSCQLSLALPAGTYSGTVGPPNAASPTAVAFTVTPNAPNLFALTTGGVPAQLTVVPASAMSAVNAQGGLDLYGAGRHPVLVEALDQNQNVIVGGGASTFTLTQAGGALALAVAQANNAAPNLFYLTPGGQPNASTALLRATASYLGMGNPCAQAGATCQGSMRVDVRQTLAVANAGANSVTLYVNAQSAPIVSVQSAVTSPQALAFDVAGDLFVANQPNSVTEYVPPYATAATTIVSGINRPQALAVDSRGNLFVANGSGSNTVTIYAVPYNGPPAVTLTAGIGDPVSLAVDPSSDLFVVNEAADTVTIYQPPYNGAPTVISKGLSAPNSLALDAHGNLFVANLNSTPNSVVEYSPPFSNQSAPVVTITNGINEQGAIALSGTASLFVPNQGANTVTEYVAPYAAAPTTISGGLSQPTALALDALGNLYVANYGNNTVSVYAPPYANVSWTTLSNGINLPQGLALSPATNAGAAVLP